ncbi:hypothetical protein R5R35_001810 [Gryllus longicercus]|uniref:Uncharacterized protein n=1 Tax=Gryllus longicercus TaxID=2509291 RepID=A0AAN9WIJ4_9ORTH
MESSLDPHDELRRLQDKVRKLELQNEQLRSQQFSRNGFDLEVKPNILSSLSDLEYYKNRLDQSNHNWEDEFLKPDEVNWENCQNEEIWLYKPKNDNHLPKNTRVWIRQDVDNQNDYEMQSIRRLLIDRIEEIEQGTRKSFIDTRTFTRPKKRITRPSLEGMSERSILNRQVIETPWKKLMSKQITEMIDDISMNYDYTLPSLSNTHFNATLCKEDSNLNATFLKVASESKSVIVPHTSLNTTFVKLDEENSDLKSSDSDQSTNSRKTSDSCLNATFLKGTSSPVTTLNTTRTRQAGLNCTYSHSDNRGHAASCDSGADDDQLSSASDSSFSSTTRLMNAGDVQTIARLQEESLKQITSTPIRTNSRNGINLLRGEDSLSPIKQIIPEQQQGYLSDHSDHSSLDGRAKSSRSSVRSSPSSSPFGSTNALANECYQLPPVVRREGKGIQPTAVKSDTRKPEVATKLAGGGQRRVVSGLRPPTVRPGTASRPSTAGASNIPRPASRIPAPRVRSAYTAPQAAQKADWMDGCY